MLTIVFIIGLICAIILTGLFCGLETASYAVNRIRLMGEIKAGNHNASRIASCLDDMPSLIIALLIGTNITVDLGTYMLTTHLQSLHIASAEVITTIILTPIYFIFAETLPKRLAYQHPNDFLIHSSRILHLLQKYLWPISSILGFAGVITGKILHKAGIRKQVSTGKDFLADSLEAGAYEGALTDRQFAMAQKIITLDNLTVGDIMLPPNTAIGVLATEKCEQAAKHIMEHGFTRALLITENSELAGKVITLNAIMRNPGALSQPVEHLASDAMRIDARTPVIRAINKMREEGARLAVAVNAGGKAVGAIPFSRLLGCVTGGIRL